MGSPDEALRYFARRDLLGEDVGPVQALWKLPDARRILQKQQADGSWPRAGTSTAPAVNYRLIETWRNFRVLVDQYGFTRKHPQARRAAEFIFSCQTEDGDIRGMLADQYATYYTGALLGLLIQSGYAHDPRITKGIRWLLSMRQLDGGWTIPILTHAFDRSTLHRLTSRHAEPVEPDRTKPFSHHWTGMVLRAFAAHPKHRTSVAALAAGRLLKSRFFKPDAYGSYRAPSYWLRFGYPFWWTNLVTALDSLSLLGFSSRDAGIREALDWLREHQERSGLWRTSYADPKARATDPWVTLAVARVLRRFHP
jgi:hypothetical protein